jgi:hypothetical protein
MRSVGKLLTPFALFALIGASLPASADEPAGGWLTDDRGCKVYNPSPKPKETAKWSGGCKDGYAEGKGVLEFFTNAKPGARYEGTMKRGRFDGRGLLKTPDGATYDGDWAGGLQDGYGVYTAADKSSFRGGWTAGKPDGPGVMTSADGQVVKGVWSDGKYLAPYDQGQGTIKRKE